MKILSSKANFYTFKTYPLNLWIFSFICLMFAIYINYYLFRVARRHESLQLIYVMMFLFYFICFACLYAGKIEYLYIDKKKGIIRKRLINIFLVDKHFRPFRRLPVVKVKHVMRIVIED